MGRPNPEVIFFGATLTDPVIREFRVQPLEQLYYGGENRYYLQIDLVNCIIEDNLYLIDVRGIESSILVQPSQVKFYSVKRVAIEKTEAGVINELAQKRVFESGAQRSSDADDYAYHLFHPYVMKRVAKVWRTGGNRYGEYNWERGMPPMECLNHCLKHIFDWIGGDDSEDHLAHAICNLFMAIAMWEFQRDKWKHTRRGLNYSLTPEILAAHDEFKRKQKLEGQ
jgi:hypothetical protein